MDWNRFDPRGQDKSEAFEAFAGMLFERWCRREYAGRLREVRFVEGKGGDGGIEAYALLASGDVIGLQAKWFRDGLGDAQIRQINNSFKKATEVRPRIVRYCVALPQRFNDDRGRGQKSERDRWNEWLAKTGVSAPGVQVELWDEARLQAELSEPENEGLHAYWFTDSIISLADLKRRFEAAEAGWLSQRYIPDLHAIGRLEEDLALRLGSPTARAKILGSVEKATSELSGLRDDVARLARLPSFQREIPDAEELRRDAMEALERMVRAGETLADALRRCVLSPEAQRPSERDEEPLRRLRWALLELERDTSFVPTRAIRERLDRCTTEAGQPPSVLRGTWECWSRASHLGAYVGSPGVGKTHGLAHAIEQRLARGQPAMLLRARDCPVEYGWEAILRNALGRPNARLIELFNAMEATAARAEVHCVRQRADQVEPHASIEPEPGFFFIAIDGLEEPGKHRRWAERIGELSVHLSHHPRTRAAVALRAASCDEILGRVRSDLYDKVELSEGGDVQLLLPKYCAYWGIALPDRRVRWAIRDPLSLRLYCELRSGSSSRSAWGLAPQDVSLPMLLREKLQRMEEELKEKSASSGPVPLREALTAIVEAYLERGALQRDDVIGLVRKAAPNDALTANDASWLLNQASEHGLLLVHVIEPEDVMARPVELVEPAIEPLIDYLIALEACSDAAAALQRGESPSLPQPLQLRHDALTQAAIVLAQKRISLVRSGLWRDQVPSETIERLELRAIAALDHGAARTYHDWVLERLRASMPSCRRVLAELCVPVARDTAHPFGPRFVHEALLPLPPAQRDQFWSGPRLLPGEGGQPWEGHGDAALETLALEADDPADGPPLLLAWALTSLDSQWRREVRTKLVGWGSRNISELIQWLNLTASTNDPQMAEDLAMVAYGAACLAGADPALEQLVEWVDRHLLAPHAVHRLEDVAVLHGARGIVERARVMGFAVDPVTLERARALYSLAEETLPIDAEAARSVSEAHGVAPVAARFAWYVVPPAIDPFFRYAVPMDLHNWTPERADRLDPRASRILRAHAERAQLDVLSPMGFACGVLVAHLREMGWNERIRMDGAILRYYGESPRGDVSPVCTLVEKYIRTGCRMLQAFLAARAPAPSLGKDEQRSQPPVDPVLIAWLDPNPASEAEMSTSVSRMENPWIFEPDDGLAASMGLVSEYQVDRAVEWVMNAPLPMLEPWLLLSQGAAPPLVDEDDDWITLSANVRARERDSQADTALWIGSAVLVSRDAALLAQEVALQVPRGLCSLSEPRDHVGGDPVEAIWAPWACDDGREDVFFVQGPAGMTRVKLKSTFAQGGHQELRGSARSYLLPACWLRNELGLIDAKAQGSGENWCFIDREGSIQAVYADHHSGGLEWREALVIRRRTLERVLAGGQLVLVWIVHLLREPNPSIVNYISGGGPSAVRDWYWLALMHEHGTNLIAFPGSGRLRGAVEPEPPGPAAPASPTTPAAPSGPGNPDLATPLTTDLDDDQAIPYFLWDDPMPVAEIRRRLATASPPERDRLLGKILREARDPDVWRFTSPSEVAARFSSLSRYLGRRLSFWRFLLNLWHKEGLLEHEPA